MSLIFIHGPVILPDIFNTVSWVNIVPGIEDQSDTVNDLILFIGHWLYVVVLLFYVHGKHLRSCRDGQLT